MKRIMITTSCALLLASCQKKVTLKAVHPTWLPVEATVTTISTGTVEADQQAILNFSASGKVEAIYYKLGDRVKRGTVIARLDNSDLKTVYQQAKKELERSEELAKENLISKVALDEAQKAYEIAKSNYERSVLTAPFDGILTELNLNIGESANQPNKKTPVRIVDEKPRLIVGQIDEMDLSKVKVGQEARIRIPAVSKEPFPGKVTKVIAFIDTTKDQDRTSEIRIQLNPTDTPIPVGASSEIEITVDQKEKALAIPTRAVLGSGQSRFVFKVNSGRIQKTPITVGLSNYDRTEVTAGLTEKDLVVFPSEEVELVDNLKVSAQETSWP